MARRWPSGSLRRRSAAGSPGARPWLRPPKRGGERAVVIERPGHDHGVIARWCDRRRCRRPVKTPGPPDRISLGRPVEPPDVGAFQIGAMRSGGGAVVVGQRQQSGRCHSAAGRSANAARRSGSGSAARSITALASAAGRRWRDRLRRGPELPQAMAGLDEVDAVGRPTVTRSPGFTPAVSRARERRLAVAVRARAR